MHKYIDNAKRFIRNEDGIATAWAIGWLILCFAIAGLSIDATNAWKVRQILQSTADMAAHAGGLELEEKLGADQIRAAVVVAANDYASKNMNTGRYGDVLVDSDIEVGIWDRANERFVPLAANSTDIATAVRVTTRQDGVNSSRVGTFFLRFVGFDAFTVAAVSTVERFITQCDQDGLIARGSVRMSTQQRFMGRFCVHGQAGINASDQNVFDLGTTAGMLDLSDCGPLPENCTDEYNPGIEDALRQSNMTFGKVDRIAENIIKLQNPYSDIIPDYIDTTLPVNRIIDTRNFEAFTDLVPNAVNIIECRAGEDISMGGLANLTNSGGNNTDTGTDSIGQSETLSEMVIVGIGCDFAFDQTIAYEDAYIATTSTTNQTFSGSAGVRLGRDDNCADEGEVTLISAGSVSFAAQLEANDLEIVTAMNASFASRATQGQSIHKGTNVWAGGNISVTSQHTFEPCGEGGETDYDRKYVLRYVE